MPNQKNLCTRTYKHARELSIPRSSPEQTYATIANLTPPETFNTLDVGEGSTLPFRDFRRLLLIS